MTTRFYLDFRGRAADGKGSLLIILAHNNTTASISTGIRLSHEEWDGDKIVRRDDSVSLNAVINKKKSDLDLALALLSADDNFYNMTATELKRAVIKNPRSGKKPESHLISDLFTEYMKTDIKEGTKIIYAATLNKVLAYGGKKCVIEDIDYKWLVGFERYLAQTQGVNGRGIYLRDLRAVCNFAKKLGVTKDYGFETFSIKTEETRKLSVPVKTLREFHDIPVNKSTERYRDYFFLMFYLIGINIGDLVKLRKDSIVNNRLEYIRAKTHKVYSIKIEPEAYAIINKYPGKKYLLDALETCQHYKSFRHMINDALKTIGDIKWEMVPDLNDMFAPPKLVKNITPLIQKCTTNCARHCWATYAQEIGIPIDVISNALGHSFGNRTTMIYVKFDRTEVDKANRKVIDYFLNKQERSGGVLPQLSQIQPQI